MTHVGDRGGRQYSDYPSFGGREPIITEVLADLLKLGDEQSARSALEPLRSVLHVSEHGRLISTLHASFPDYMFNHGRSGRFFCEEGKHSEILARGCFETMEHSLRFNICDLESSFVCDMDVPDL
jgi:hypothetical protein